MWPLVEPLVVLPPRIVSPFYSLTLKIAVLDLFIPFLTLTKNRKTSQKTIQLDALFILMYNPKQGASISPRRVRAQLDLILNPPQALSSKLSIARPRGALRG